MIPNVKAKFVNTLFSGTIFGKKLGLGSWCRFLPLYCSRFIHLFVICLYDCLFFCFPLYVCPSVTLHVRSFNHACKFWYVQDDAFRWSAAYCFRSDFGCQLVWLFPFAFPCVCKSVCLPVRILNLACKYLVYIFFVSSCFRYQQSLPTCDLDAVIAAVLLG